MTELLVFLTTYALHSTILALIAIALARVVRNESWREVIYRTALVGGIGTAAFMTLQPASSPPSRWTIEAPGPLVRAGGIRSSSSGAPHLIEVGRSNGKANQVTGGAVTGSKTGWLIRAAVSAWAGIALLLLFRMVAAQLRLHRRIADRGRLRSGPTWERMREMAAASAQAPVPLSIVRFDGSPFVIWPAEICLPEWFPELDGSHQSAALAHELAHVRRGDALWQLTGRLIESIFFFQPLNRLLRLQLQTLAEQLCDDAAVRHLADPLDLARCLTTVAERMMPVRIAAPAMIGRRCALLMRVERIACRRSSALPERNLLLAGAVLMLGGFAALAPALGAEDGIVLTAEPTAQHGSPTHRGGFFAEGEAEIREAAADTLKRHVLTLHRELFQALRERDGAAVAGLIEQFSAYDTRGGVDPTSLLPDAQRVSFMEVMGGALADRLEPEYQVIATSPHGDELFVYSTGADSGVRTVWRRQNAGWKASQLMILSLVATKQMMESQ